MNNTIELISKYSESIIIYLLVIIGASFLAYLSYRRSSTNKYIWRKQWYVVSFLILLVFMGFANCGEDYLSYSRIFENSFDWTYAHNIRIERGYLVFNMCIRAFTKSFEVYHFIWALVILFLVYSTIEKYKEILKPGWCIFGYTCLFMFQALNLMRMYLAISIIFWGIRYVIENKKLKFLIVLLIAFTIHRSSICVFVPYLMWVLFSKKEHYSIKIVATAVLYVGIFAVRNVLFSSAVLGYQYSGETTGSIGLAQIIYALPILLVFTYYRYYKKEYIYDTLLSSLFIFFLSSFVFSLMSYSITTMGRVLFYFTYPYMVLPQYVMTKRLNECQCQTSWRYVSIQDLIGVLFIIYYLFRAFMMVNYIETDGLQYYSNVLGFIAK